MPETIWVAYVYQEPNHPPSYNVKRSDWKIVNRMNIPDLIESVGEFVDHIIIVSERQLDEIVNTHLKNNVRTFSKIESQEFIDLSKLDDVSWKISFEN